MNFLEIWEDRLIKIFNKATEEDGHCKSGEPSIKIGISNTKLYWCEIYSYVVDYAGSGRHHLFEADTFEELIIKVEKAISEQERNYGIGG